MAGAAPGEARPRVGRAMREAAVDLWFNSWRVVAGNCVWGAGLVAVAALAAVWAPLGLAAALLALPVAGLSRMGAMLARDEHVEFSDFVDGMRRLARASLSLGALATAAAVVLGGDLLIGMRASGPAGWALGVLAAYGLLALACVLLAAWPILADRAREGIRLRRVLRLAALVTLAAPLPMLALTGATAALLAASTVLFPALLTVSVGYALQVAARVVLPLADLVEARTGWGTAPGSAAERPLGDDHPLPEP